MRQEQADTGFKNAVEDNRAALLAYFQRRLLNPDDAAEAFGELLLTAWRLHRRMPSEPTEARMWLYGVAHNVLRNSRRTLARRSAAVQRLADDLRSAAPESVDDVALSVREAIASLADDDAELVRLIYWDGLASHEAAAVLHINPSTARTRLARAKQKLKSALSYSESICDEHASSLT
ncbi:RNA polymerase sigma factor [Microbacterium sp. AZCO]|uniref:RNA polymerase sigma factor n=1 Tax=Microbacterium sp. AZCO TaxID=3142976 RepID=UPI0031F403B3